MIAAEVCGNARELGKQKSGKTNVKPDAPDLTSLTQFYNVPGNLIQLFENLWHKAHGDQRLFYECLGAAIERCQLKDGTLTREVLAKCGEMLRRV